MNHDEGEVFKGVVKKVVEKLYEFGVNKKKYKDIYVYTLDNPEQFLNWSVTNDLLLHGSTRLINECLVPYQANDKFKESGNRKAVYITRVPAVAMFCALTGGIDGLKRKHVSHTTINEGVVGYQNMYFGVDKQESIKEIGYVYILDKVAADEEINGEFLSYRDVYPVAVIEINIRNFPFKIEQFKDDD